MITAGVPLSTLQLILLCEIFGLYRSQSAGLYRSKQFESLYLAVSNTHTTFDRAANLTSKASQYPFPSRTGSYLVQSISSTQIQPESSPIHLHPMDRPRISPPPSPFLIYTRHPPQYPLPTITPPYPHAPKRAPPYSLLLSSLGNRRPTRLARSPLPTFLRSFLFFSTIYSMSKHRPSLPYSPSRRCHCPCSSNGHSYTYPRPSHRRSRIVAFCEKGGKSEYLDRSKKPSSELGRH
jgi:hypothetical protein